jgi:hypothetical protein
MLRECTAVAMSSFLALGPSMSAWAVPSNGTVSGQVTIDGRPLQGLGLALIDLKSGEIHRTKSNAKGDYRWQVLPGEYAVTTVSLAGLSVGKAPSRVVVEPGRVVVASLELMKLAIPFQTQTPEPAQTPPASGPQTAGNITFEPVGCMVAGQFPLIEATIQPAASVARARVYFKSALSPAFYYVEMVQGADGKFVGKLPKPKLEASPITWYIMSIMTEGSESQTGETQSVVVADESECPEGLKVAPIGPPGAVTVFSAATAAVAVPVGFAAGGLAIAGGTLAAILLGLGAAAGAVAATGDETTTTLAPTTTTTAVVTTTTTTTTTPPPTTTTTTTLPNCSYNTAGQPTNCPCIPLSVPPATGVSATPPPAGTCP